MIRDFFLIEFLYVTTENNRILIYALISFIFLFILLTFQSLLDFGNPFEQNTMLLLLFLLLFLLLLLLSLLGVFLVFI